VIFFRPKVYKKFHLFFYNNIIIDKYYACVFCGIKYFYENIKNSKGKT